MKPVELVGRALRNSGRPGDMVLDAFGGSGTTLIGAEKAGRRARLMELHSKYRDVIIRRWQDWSSQRAVRVEFPAHPIHRSTGGDPEHTTFHPEL